MSQKARKKIPRSSQQQIVFIGGIALLLGISLLASQTSQENRTLATTKKVNDPQTVQQLIDTIPLEIIGMVVVILVTILVILRQHKE